MRAGEIRVGNIVRSRIQAGTFYDVIVIESDFGGNYKMFEPIPLTEEWLFRFGFENKGHGFSDNIYYKQQEWANWAYSVTISKTGIVMKHGFMNQWSELKALKYVHELQNLYFALTSEELTLSK